MSSPQKRSKKGKKNAFGATAPPFIDYLKEILRRYPDGGQILKELIQNADDAGASEIIFIHDKRTYSTHSVWSEALGKYQGPALYAFNNAVFTEEDWEGIQRAGRSIKHNDPTKVGRFGIGFNSVYHLTDLPCVFSSKHLAVFDPQKLMFDDEQEGYRWSLDDAKDTKDLLEFTDQFKPFQDIVQLLKQLKLLTSDWKNVLNEKNFNGTLFRFPLRNVASEISDNLYYSKKVTQLFESFIPDADISLLFLRSVNSIRLVHIDSSGAVCTKLKVSASSPSKSLEEPKVNNSPRNYLQGKTSFKNISCQSSNGKETTTKWLVTASQLIEGRVPEIDTLASKLSFYPQVDLAFQCDENRKCDPGRLSCFLPLPNNETNRTGLPVNINACFGLTDNRRYIKWQEEDQKNDESAQWNELLIKEVLPHVYLMIIQDAIKLSQKSELPASSVYNIWPDLSKTEHRPRWHKVTVDVLKELFQHQELFSLAKNEKRWVSASAAVFPTDTDTQSAVVQLLIKEGENLITIPERVLTAIKKTFPNSDTLKWVTPHFVRSVLRKSDIRVISKNDKLSLLEFVLSDGKYDELNGLQLLPLSDGSFRSFTNREEDTALIDNDEFSRVLLPFCKEKFLPADLNKNTLHHLRRMAQTNSNLYKVINLNAVNVAAFTRKNLPTDWKESGHVKWNSTKDDHPPKAWLKEFWKFLNTHWAELSEFTGIPLIPLEPLHPTSNSSMLARLERNPTLIFQSSRESSLSDQVQKMLKLVGGTVIKKDECLKHHDIESYVLKPSPKNVLQVMLNCKRDSVISGITCSSVHEKEEFKTYISFMNNLSGAEQSLLLTLPLFRLMSGKYVSVQSKQAIILKSNPTIPENLPVPDTNVQCANEADTRLLTLLNIKLLDAAELAINLTDCIEVKQFNKEDEQKIMTWILNNGNLLFSQSGTLLSKCKTLHFIVTQEGECKQPSSVFDPTKKVFLDLFEENFFPPHTFRTAVMLDSLKQLGLKTKEKDISSKDVLHVASQIQKLHIYSGNKAFKKADVLVKVLKNNNLLLELSEVERQKLLQLQWVPCKNPSAMTYQRNLYKPTEIRASKYSEIVGHVMPLTSDLSESICQKLDLFEPPPAEKVLENLYVLGTMARGMGNPDSNYEFKNKLHKTYEFMQENIENFREQVNQKCIPWLWSQTEFVLPRDVVLQYPNELDLSFYIKKVPDEFLKYAKLLREFGVKNTLSDEVIEDILHDIKQSIDDRDPPFGNSSELKLIIAILDWMRKNEKPLTDSTPVPVTAEGHKFTLKALKDTVFCDISEEGLDDLRQDQEEIHVIHEEVLPITAKWMKIPFLSTRILKPQLIGEEEEEEDEGIEQWGQAEPITQRIKNILKEYDEETDIFKELIQNAEDAGASTCGFLLDFRTHPTEFLIDEGMAFCNGPSLWAFNNELFSEEDWKNIVRVGAASKENKLEKIGKFGLGFNAVYHLTDIPSILSGKTLLILDPNVTHLEKHIRSKATPGIKLDLFRDRLFRRFPGQFKAYQGIFDCDLSIPSEKYYEGTLIKLPFRTVEEASKSEVSSKVYDKERINAFQQHLANDSQAPLLFLKHIKTLSLQVISADASTPPPKDQIKTIQKISREVVCSLKISNKTHLQDIKDTLKILDQNCHGLVDSFEAHINEVIYGCDDEPRKQFWLIYSCFGTKDSQRMFQRKIQQCSFSLPVGGVAVPLQRKTQHVWSPDENNLVGQAFCFLPLPIDTGLPVHINGSFAVTSNRKALWESGTKLEWNKALLQDAVASAYINTLLELKKMTQDENLQTYDYHTFWPDVNKVNKAFQPLVEAFYSAIVQNTGTRSLELFSNGQIWCSFEKARFLDPEIQENKVVGDLAMEVFLEHSEKSYCAVHLPLWVKHSLIKCGFSEILEEKTFHWVDFYQVVLQNLNVINPHCRNVLILNAIDLNDKEVDSLLTNYPCIPTQKTGTLQFINRLVHPQGKIACLYDPDEGRFLDSTKQEYFTPKRVQRLSDLGMIHDNLSLEEIVGRAKRISRVWEKDTVTAYKCLKCLFDSMKQHLLDSSTHWQTLTHISFLPAQGPDQHNSTLKQPSEVYSYQCYHLVSLTESTVDTKLDSWPDVFAKLGVNFHPSIEKVLQQLKEAHNHSKDLENSVLLDIAKYCYNYLNTHLLEDGDPTVIVTHAYSLPFVFIEDHFVNVKSVALNEGFEEKPFLYILPTIFSKYENLWKCVGMNSQFTAEQFHSVLEQMSNLPKPLSKKKLMICLSVIIKGLYHAQNGDKHCLLPDEKGVLTHSSMLNFNDSAWMPVQAGVTLCHKLIPRDVALHFGVTTTRHHTLNNHLVKGFALFAKEFGQHEKLTTRIKNIIDAYPAKKDILKELIQNADDAEATEIHFVWDKRKHGTTKIFGEKWELLQGPALCVYNNKPFSNEDLKGIQQLGEGGKRGTLGRTGKYGLGFNSVYQLTDCPAILSGDEYLCISDPNLQYVEGGTKESPGRLFSMDTNFKESFQDVYNTFLPEQFKLSEGTMFRLPLRTEEMATKSEISINAVTDFEIKELFQALQEDPEELILFLKHVKKIYFFAINKDGNEERKFLIEKKITDDTKEEAKSFHNHVLNSLKYGTVTPCQMICKAQIISGKKESSWVIAEQFGSFMQNQNEGEECNKVPQAAVAACVRNKTEKGVRNKTEKDFKGGVFCSLPLPIKTGLPVHINGNFEVDFSRRDLWKEDGKSLKTDWNQLLHIYIIAPLYADLLEYICTRFKMGKPTKLIFLKSHLDFCLKYFPFVSKDVAQVWHEMIIVVYRSINERNLPVIPTLKSVPNESSHSLDPNYTIIWSSVLKPDSTDSPNFLEDRHSGLLHILEHAGMILVPISLRADEMKCSFNNAGVKVAEISPLSVINFLKTKKMNDPLQTTSDLPLPIGQTLIKDSQSCSKLLKFCQTTDCKSTKEENKSGYVDINGLPLLLTRDQMLRKFNSDSPKLTSQFAHIFVEHQSEFVDPSVINACSTLLQEGKFIQKLTIPMAAQFIRPVIKQQLQHSLPDEKNGLFTAEKENMALLKELWSLFEKETKQETNQVFKEIKVHFSDIPILPVINHDNRRFLQTLGKLQSVVPDPKDKISSVLLKLGFMTLDRNFFLGMYNILYEFIIPELLNINDPDAVLKLLYLVPHLQFAELSGDESDELQNYLQSGISTFKNEFKSLPLFETIHGNRQGIDLHGNVFVLKTEFRDMFPSLFTFDDSKGIFLKHNYVNEGLTKCLNIPILKDLEYCVKFMIPVLHTFSESRLLDLIKLVVILSQKPEYKNCKAKIISALKNVRFIQDINGCPQMASYFFDEAVHLFKVMLSKQSFVPNTFWKLFDFQPDLVYAKVLLKDLGLKHEVSEKQIIEFAYQIEADAKGNTDLQVLKVRSKTLLNEALYLSSLNAIASIKFIFPVQVKTELCEYHKSFAQERNTVPIKGSLLEKDPDHQYLIWTSMPVLPTADFSTKYLDILKEAGALDKPPSEQVMENIQNICRSHCAEECLVHTRAEVFRKSYAYLQSTNFEESMLFDLPLVLVENDASLVKAYQVVLTLPNAAEFRPYLYPIQGKDAMFAEFFKKVGVKEKPTVTQLCTVLQEIYTECINKSTLNPNQQKTIQRAVQQLFYLIKDEPKPNHFQKTTLHLPSTDGKLYESSTLFFNDTFFQAKRLEDSLKSKLNLLEKLNRCHIKGDTYEHQKLLQLLPETNRPKLLSQVISVHLAGGNPEHCDDGQTCEFSGWFRKHLSSDAFRHGLICLIRAQSKGSVSQTDSERMFECTFGKIQIYCCKALFTELMLNQEPLEGTKTETQVYVKKCQDQCLFYLKHSETMAPKIVNEVNMNLSKEINSLLGNILNSEGLLVVGQLLFCENMEHIEEALEKNGIHNTMSEVGGLGARPSPGSLIPEEWHDSLDMDPLNHYEKGEYVGFTTDESEPKYYYAIIVECLDDMSDQTRPNPARFKIQIGNDEFIEVSSLDLYQFKRERVFSNLRNSTCTDIAIFLESVPSQQRPIPQNLEEVKREIDQSLKQIWNMSEEDKRKALKRLYLKWHPDKNEDNVSLATEAFKYLQNRIEELKRGNIAGTSQHNKSHNWFNSSDFFTRWNNEARSHRRGRERFYQNNSRGEYNFWSYFKETPRPDKAEAKRWYRQAQCDLGAAQNGTRQNESPEWCLFKVHQAVEKALIATKIRRDGQNPETGSSITSIAMQISHYAHYLGDIPNDVNQLRALGVDAKKTQYPNCHPKPNIPNDQFTSENALRAVNIATDLLKKLDKYISD